MPKNSISDYSKTNTSNTDVHSVSIAEGMAPSDVNNAMREIMVDLARIYDGTDSILDLKIGDDIALVSDAAELTFGENSEIKFIHDHDVGLKLKHTATGDDKPIALTLQTGETDVVADEIIGSLYFQAPDEAGGTDAITIAAGISAVAEDTFAADNNKTSLVFKTGSSAAAADRIKITSDGHIVPAADNTSDLGTGSLEFKDAYFDGTVETDALTIGGTNVVTGSLITTLGTVSAGTWNGSTVGVAYGGTGATSLTDGGVLFGSGTGAITATAVLGDGEMLVGDASGDPAIESGATLRTSIGLGSAAVLDTGISNTNVPKFTTGAADDDFLRIDGTAIEGRSASEVLSDIGAGAAAGSSSIVTTGALDSGSITSGFGSIDNGSSTANFGATTVDSLSVSDGNITNVGDIDLDSITPDGTAITTSASGAWSFEPHGTSTGNCTELRFLELAANGTNYSGFKAPDAVTSNNMYTLPVAYPASNKVLQSTDAGVLTWESAAAGMSDVVDDTSPQLGGTLDCNSNAIDLQGLADGLILSADTNTTISAPTNGQIDFELGGSDIFKMTTTGFTGKILNAATVQDEGQQSISSTSYADITGATVSITPKSTSSKILVMGSVTMHGANSFVTMHRDISGGAADTNMAASAAGLCQTSAGSFVTCSICHLDAPSTTSAVTYNLLGKNSTGTTYVGWGASDFQAELVAVEICEGV